MIKLTWAKPAARANCRISRSVRSLAPSTRTAIIDKSNWKTNLSWRLSGLVISGRRYSTTITFPLAGRALWQFLNNLMLLLSSHMCSTHCQCKTPCPHAKFDFNQYLGTFFNLFRDEVTGAIYNNVRKLVLNFASILSGGLNKQLTPEMRMSWYTNDFSCTYKLSYYILTYDSWIITFMKMASPEGTLVNMSPPTNSTPANIQVLKFEKMYTITTPEGSWKLLSTNFPVCNSTYIDTQTYLKNLNLRWQNMSHQGASPNERFQTVLHNITWKASYEPTQASTNNGMHNLVALWQGILQVM